MVTIASGNGSLDRYVVLEYLSEGGMGAIFIGKKLGAGGFEKPVVLKQLLPEFTSQPEFIDLFLREARLSATLDHANIVHTIDLVTAGEDHFIVMEYLAGADLRTLLQKAKRRRKRLSPEAGIYIARELLSALAYAHAKVGPDGQPLKLIHRDVSPSNILVSHIGEVKLTDFGIAKAATHNSIFYRVKGKVGYMSPEQARSEAMDHRSDLYSLAVCLYEVLTGEKLFVHVGLTTSAEEMYSQPVPAISKKIRGVPAELDQVMFKALAVDPDQRYQTAGEFQDALLRCAHRAGLMISTPELASHLLDVCGDPAQWRDLDSERASGELYEQDEEGTEQIGLDELGEDEPAARADGNERGPRRRPSFTSMSDINRLRGVELTSIIRSEPAGNEPVASAPDRSPRTMPAASAPVQQADDARRRYEQSGLPSLAHLSPDGYRNVPNAPAAQGNRMQPMAAPGRDAYAAPSPRPVGPAPASETRAQPRSRVWLVWVVILVLGLIAAAVVGLSGPVFDEKDLAPATPGETGSEPAPTSGTTSQP